MVLLLTFLFLFSSCAVPQNNRQIYKPQKETSATILLEEFQKESKEIGKSIRKKDKENALKETAQAEYTLEQLKKSSPEKGSKDLFMTYCEAASGIYLDVENQVGHSYWEKAESSFHRIKRLNKEMSQTFVPSGKDRFISWLKRIFSGKS